MGWLHPYPYPAGAIPTHRRYINGSNSTEANYVIQGTSGVLPIRSVGPEQSITIRRKHNTFADFLKFKPLFHHFCNEVSPKSKFDIYVVPDLRYSSHLFMTDAVHIPKLNS
jgi:hypothetical protein